MSKKRNYAETLLSIAEGAAQYCNENEAIYLNGFSEWLKSGKVLTSPQFMTLASIARNAIVRKDQVEAAEHEFALWLKTPTRREALTLVS